MTGVQILDRYGDPMPPARENKLAGAPAPRPSALNGSHNAPYDAGDLYSQEMAGWQPYLWSPDAQINPWRDRIVSRIRDLAQNDGWAAGGIMRITDNVVGANLRPISRPDHKSLQYLTGNKGFDAVWAREFAAQVDANFRAWGADEGKYCSADRLMTFNQQMRVGFRHKLLDGDALAVMKWLPRRVRPGRARYCTAAQLVDPDRLSNPQTMWDRAAVRGGVELDPDDEFAPCAYHIRKAHQGDWWAAADSVTWERIPKETAWGRAIVVHDYDVERAGQHRGTGVLTPVLQRLKMLTKYDVAELNAAVINAIFSAYIESPFDHQLVAQAMGDEAELSMNGAPMINQYQADRASFHNDRKIMLGGSRIPTLYPGEKITSVTAARPASNFDAFETAVLRNVGSAIGLSAPQMTNNWSNVNYSSARAALLEFWKTLGRRRSDFGSGFAGPVRLAWLEESMDVDAYPLPNGVVPEFFEARGAYGRCKWMGPGRGVIDAVQEAQGSLLRLNGGLSTLEDECAEQGLEWEEVLEQRKEEIEKMKEAGLTLPPWAGSPALEASKKPGLDNSSSGGQEGAAQ